MPNYILQGFEILFYGFHISVLILLHFKRTTNFEGPFYAIFRVILFADVVCYLSVWGATRMLELKIFSLKFFQSDQVVSSILYTVISIFTVMQFVGHFLLSFNRFTILWFPLKHKQIWRHPWFLAILVGIPFAHNCYRFHVAGAFIILEDEKTTVTIRDQKFNGIVYIMSFTLYGINAFLAAVFNFLAIFKLIWHKHNSPTFNANEKNLFFVSFVTFCAELLRIIYVIATHFFSSNKEILGFLLIVAPYVIDIFGCCGSITLITLSSITREAYMSFYKLKRAQKPVTWVSTTF